MTTHHTIEGRRGYFLVVSLPDGDASGGFESDFLDAGNADREANGINGLKAIYWQFIDEQPRKSPWTAVRHLVGAVPTDKPILTAKEREALRTRRDELKESAKKSVTAPHMTDAMRREAWDISVRLAPPKAAGVWSVCEAWLISMGTAAGKPGKKNRGI